MPPALSTRSWASRREVASATLTARGGRRVVGGGEDVARAHRAPTETSTEAAGQVTVSEEVVDPVVAADAVDAADVEAEVDDEAAVAAVVACCRTRGRRWWRRRAIRLARRSGRRSSWSPPRSIGDGGAARGSEADDGDADGADAHDQQAGGRDGLQLHGLHAPGGDRRGDGNARRAGRRVDGGRGRRCAAVLFRRVTPAWSRAVAPRPPRCWHSAGRSTGAAAPLQVQGTAPGRVGSNDRVQLIDAGRNIRQFTRVARAPGTALGRHGGVCTRDRRTECRMGVLGEAGSLTLEWLHGLPWRPARSADSVDGGCAAVRRCETVGREAEGGHPAVDGEQRPGRPARRRRGEVGDRVRDLGGVDEPADRLAGAAARRASRPGRRPRRAGGRPTAYRSCRGARHSTRMPRGRGRQPSRA